MRKSFCNMICAAMALMLSAGSASSAEIDVLTVGSLRTALNGMLEQVQNETGNTLNVTYVNPAIIEDEFAQGDFDVVIAATSSAASFAEAGTIDTDTHISLARTGIGISVREGAPMPDLSTPESFRAAVLAARNVVYSNPQTLNGSGILTQQIFDEADLLEAIEAKGLQSRLGAGRDLIASGEYEIGFFNISEGVSEGVIVAGPVPEPYQRYTNYEAAVASGASDPQAAAALIGYLARPERAEAWAAGGIELMAGR
ncbi:MAG: substrate-binding domain-containing protein [Proteobacteria bacterium]|nr:substrate-binding domain-containing protein [Pseudomonadota bacterium]